MNECLNGETHGPVHILIGGAWESTGDPIVWTAALSSLQSDYKILLFKMLWRSGFTRCPSSCTSEGTVIQMCIKSKQRVARDVNCGLNFNMHCLLQTLVVARCLHPILKSTVLATFSTTLASQTPSIPDHSLLFPMKLTTCHC